MAKLEYFAFLRGWIGLVALMAFGNTFQCFSDHSFLANRLYTGSPELANVLAARLFGVWTLFSGILRLYCAFNIYNKHVYNLTMVSFILAFGHFSTEAWVYKTAPITIGVLAPLIVSDIAILGLLWTLEILKKIKATFLSAVSFIAMGTGYRSLNCKEQMRSKIK